MIVAFALIVLYGIGAVVGETCTSISTCKACWKNVETTINSTECPNSVNGSAEICVAKPADMQHNALVSALLCACGKAETEFYADETLNKRIEEVYNLMTDSTITAKELCDNWQLLTKRRYG